MSKILRKIVSVFLASVMITNLAFTGYAANTNLSAIELDNYIHEVAPFYLNSLGISFEKSYYLSEVFDVKSYDTEEIVGHYVFVLCEDELIGKMKINYCEEYISTFDTYIPNELQNIYDNSSAFSLVAYDDNIWAVSNNIGVAIEKNAETRNNISVSWDCADAILKNDCVSLESSWAYDDVTPRASAVVSASVPFASVSCDDVVHIPNTTYSGVWICWAACVAMAVNYHNRNVTNYEDISALDVATSEGVDVVAYGLAANHAAAYSNYNLDYQKDDDGKLTPQEMFFILRDDDCPIELGLKEINSAKDDEDLFRHAVIVKGVDLYTNYAIITLDDPTVGNGEIRTITGAHNNILANFTYSISYGGTDYSYHKTYYAYYFIEDDTV